MSGSTMTSRVDEEALAAHHDAVTRKTLGAFFTPAPLVESVIEAVAPFVPARGALRIIDPACGAGAFLVAARKRWPRADVIGVELDPIAAKQARKRVPSARIINANALLDAPWPERGDVFELWLGNPPWNGTSSLLKSKAAWERVRQWLPASFKLRPGTSLRDDFVFFLLQATRRLSGTRGALAFITSSTLLDAYAHAPVRAFMLDQLALRKRKVLPRGTFANTRVEPCVTVWTTERSGRVLKPRGESHSLRPDASDGEAIDRVWRKNGVPLSELVPLSFAGLKTRFDELLVDDDRRVLEARIKAFTTNRLGFARKFGLTAFTSKLKALPKDHVFDARNVRRFIRYRGPLERGEDGWCYLSRDLIPRGDHRLRGEFDPHASDLKLVFNRLELPLAAHVIEGDGCVTMYRHSRFAPAMVPRALIENPFALRFDASDLVPNLTPRGRALGSVREVFEHIAKHMQSDEFQTSWAPTFGTTREPLIHTQT